MNTNPHTDRDAHTVNVFSAETARTLDAQDNLSHFRELFNFPAPPPQASSERAVYLCGNSLGLQPKQTREYLLNELDDWATRGVRGHFSGQHPWLTTDEPVHADVATIVGAQPAEVAVMNSLTANLHLLMVPFYTPTKDRHKILIERHSFPSDWYAAESQVKNHGFDPKDSLVFLEPREGEHIIRDEDIIKLIDQIGDSLALVLLPGVQYYTGQFFDIKSITEAGHRKGARVGWDLAHAVGNLPLELHNWKVDFAVWCSYKYLNSGPGAIAGLFVHSNHANNNLPRFAGWWGHDLSTRFEMNTAFNPIPGAFGYRLSNPCVLSMTSLRASVDLFTKAGMQNLRKKSLSLTGYLETLLKQELSKEVTIITPSDPSRRGCQLSLIFVGGKVKEIEHKLWHESGVIVDTREPDVMRIAPAPLYNNYHDIFLFVSALKRVLSSSSTATS